MDFSPIGSFHSSATYPQQAPRQATEAGAASGTVELLPGQEFETALRDLAGFDRIWLVYVFDRAEGWRPTARPPIPPPQGDRVGVFASRSPYRPNPIGMSCVQLLSISGRTLEIGPSDLLDGTPILDIKPYIPAFDSFPEAHIGWLEEQQRDAWSLLPTADFLALSARLVALGGPDLHAACCTQLTHNPFDGSRKRVSWNDAETVLRAGTFAFRTWRMRLLADVPARSITLQEVTSGYAAEELTSEDKYGDKHLHRALFIPSK